MKKMAPALFLGSLAVAATTVVSAPAQATEGVTESMFVAINGVAAADVSEIAVGNVDPADPLAEPSSVGGTLLATAADGTGYVAEQAVVGTTKAAVFTTADGTSTILKSTATSTYNIAAGQVVTRDGNNLYVVDEATGVVTKVPALPRAIVGTRQISDFAAYGNGIIVTTVDADPASTTGNIYGSALWVYDGDTWTSVADYDDRYFPAIAVRDQIATAFSMSPDGTETGITALSGNDVTEIAADVVVPNSTVVIDVALTNENGIAVVLTGQDNTRIVDLDGNEIFSRESDGRLFTSKAPLAAVSTVVNPLGSSSGISGVPAQVVYNAKVKPVGFTTVTLPSGEQVNAASRIYLKRADGTTASYAASPATARAVTQKTCFYAAASASTFVQASKSATPCVKVSHYLAKTGYKKATRKVTMRSTAKTLRIQVKKGSTWRTVKTVGVPASKNVTFTVPAKSFRVVALATTKNTQKVLAVKVG